jgi:hypothetical protein
MLPRPLEVSIVPESPERLVKLLGKDFAISEFVGMFY